MCVWGIVRKFSWLHGVPKGRRGHLRQNSSHIGDESSEEHPKGAKFEWKSYDPHQVHLERDRQISAILQNTKEGL